MKRTTLIILVLALVMSFCIHASAETSEGVIIKINNTDIIFDANSTLTHEEKQIVAEYLVNGNPDTQTYGLICTLFGHQETTEIVTTVTHCVRATIPRCLEEDWELIVCSRCETLIEETRIGYSYIDCCPEK